MTAYRYFVHLARAMRRDNYCHDDIVAALNDAMMARFKMLHGPQWATSATFTGRYTSD